MQKFEKLNVFQEQSMGSLLENLSNQSYQKRYVAAQALRANSKAFLEDYLFLGEEGADLVKGMPQKYYNILGKSIANSLEEGRPMKFVLRGLNPEEEKNGVGFTIQITSKTTYFSDANRRREKPCCGDIIILGCKCNRKLAE